MRAEQGGLATAGLGDHDGQAAAFADLHGEVRVEEDGPAAGAGGAADQVAAAVADGRTRPGAARRRAAAPACAAGIRCWRWARRG